MFSANCLNDWISLIGIAFGLREAPSRAAVEGMMEELILGLLAGFYQPCIREKYLIDV